MVGSRSSESAARQSTSKLRSRRIVNRAIKNKQVNFFWKLINRSIMTPTATSCTIISLMALLAPAICAPEATEKIRIPNNEVNKNKKNMTAPLVIPANLSYDELIYIIQSRSGDERRAPKFLSPCARAILGCCRNHVMNESCSETLQCGAFFFDVNPCENEFVLDALKAARTFYEQFNSVPT